MERKWIAIISIVLLTLSSLEGLTRLNFDVDEAENLHSAWMVSQGKVPFVDFFQQHEPTLWYVLAPMFWLLPNDSVLPTLILSNGFVTLNFLCIVILTGWVIGYKKKSFDWFKASLGSLLLLRTWLLHDTFLTLRIDNVMIAFWLLSLGLWQRKRYLWSGVSLGVAFAFSLKLLPMLMGTGVFFVVRWYWYDRFKRRRLLRQVCLYALSFSAVAGLFYGFLALTSGVSAYYQYVFTFNRVFEYEGPTLLEILAMSWKNDSWFWILGTGLGVYVLIARVRQKRTDLLFWLVVIALANWALVLFVLKYVFPRYLTGIVMAYVFFIVKFWELSLSKKLNYKLSLLLIFVLTLPSLFFAGSRVYRNFKQWTSQDRLASNFYLREAIVQKTKPTDPVFSYLDYHPIIRTDAEYFSIHTIQPAAVGSLLKMGFIPGDFSWKKELERTKSVFLSLSPGEEKELKSILEKGYTPGSHKGFYWRINPERAPVE